MYENEAEVGEAVRKSGVPRSEVFVSKYSLESQPEEVIQFIV